MKMRTGNKAAAAVWRPKYRSSLALTLISAVLVAGVSLLPVSVGGAQAETRLVQMGKRAMSVNVVIGKSEDVRTDQSFMEVVVGDPEIADVNPLTDRTVSILGKKIGTTRVAVYAEGKKQVGIFDVEVSYDTVRLSDELARQFPRAHIRVSPVNGRIMLSGTAPDGVIVDKAVTIAKQFGNEVINSIGVTEPQQVLLEVRFVEAQRNASRELGINWQILGNTATLTTGTNALISNSTPFGTLMATLLGRGVQADLLIQALEERGVARRLAEPNLVALSGDTASFLAGGEFPFPVQGQLNQITIEFKKFGVGLAFTPTVLANGLINLKIQPEVSQLDPTNTVSINGVTIPSLIVRRASTTIELHDGQSFAMAGLLQADSSTSANQLPWIADVPILGALFRSAQYQKNETDLAIIVTPRIVRPARPIDMVRTPLDNSLPANDADLFLNGQHEVRRAPVQDISNDPGSPEDGHILDLPQRGARADDPSAGGAYVLDLPQGGDHVASR
jgi:pilus assembly protein CpaC